MESETKVETARATPPGTATEQHGPYRHPASFSPGPLARVSTELRWRRAAALVVDLAFAILVLGVVGSLAAAGVAAAGAFDHSGVTALMAALLGGLAVLLIYGRDSIGGRSVGRRVFGLRVQQLDTGAVGSPLRCAARNLVLMNCLWVDTALLFLTPDARTLSDRITGTEVVALRGKERRGSARVWRRVGYAFVALLTLGPIWALVFGIRLPAGPRARRAVITYQDLVEVKPSLSGSKERESLKYTTFVFGGARVEYEYGARDGPLYLRSTAEHDSNAEKLFAELSDRSHVRSEVGTPVELLDAPNPPNSLMRKEMRVFGLVMSGTFRGHYAVLRDEQNVVTVLILGTSLETTEAMNELLGKLPLPLSLYLDPRT